MCHVLIIEDEPLIAMLIEMMVEDAGATSWEIAVTEEEAIAAAFAHHPDVITSDVNLLEGTGPNAVAAIHARLGVMPVIYVTATPDECHPISALSVVLSKPVQKSAFHRVFRTMC
jgi:CheY-like chemotaxis protein